MSRANSEVKKHIKSYPHLLKKTLYSEHIFGKKDPASQIEKLNKIFDFIYPGRRSPNSHSSEHAQPLDSNLSTALTAFPSTLNARQLCLVLLGQWLAVQLIKEKSADKQLKQAATPFNNPVAQHLLQLLDEKMTLNSLSHPPSNVSDQWQGFKQALFNLPVTPAFERILKKEFPKTQNVAKWFAHFKNTLGHYPIEITANPGTNQASKPSAADMTVTAATAAADLQIRQEAQAKAQKQAAEQAKREAAAAQAKAQKQAAEQAKREAAAAQAKAQKQAAEQAKREAAAAQAKAQKEADELAKREAATAQAKAQKEADELAKREAVEPETPTDNDAANRGQSQQPNNLVSLGAMIQRQKELNGIGTSPSPLSSAATVGTPKSGPETPSPQGLPSTAASPSTDASHTSSASVSPSASSTTAEETATTAGLETAGSPAVEPSSPNAKETVRALQASGSPLHARPPKKQRKQTKKMDAPCHGKCSIM